MPNTERSEPRRLRKAIVIAVLVLGLSACGGGDDSSPRSETEGRDAPSPKVSMRKAVAVYNRGYDNFFADFTVHNQEGNFGAVKADIASFRTVIFELDEQIRAIEFGPSLQTDVNTILEKDRVLIARLDLIGKTKSFDEAIPIYEKALADRTASVSAINSLLDKL